MTTKRTPRKPSVKMHLGAAHDDITVDGVTFCRGDLDKDQQRTLRRMTVDALKACGFVKDHLGRERKVVMASTLVGEAA